MSLYYSVRTVIMFAIILLAPLFLIPTVSHAATTCTDTYSKSVAIPTGYGAAYNLFSSAKEMLVKTDSCTDTSLSIKAGNDSTDSIVYKEGYYWSGTSWIKYNLTAPDPLQYTYYYPKAATANIPIAAGNTSRFYVAYTCQNVSSTWKCGCQNTACTTSAWQLQQVNKTTTTPPPDPVCGNSICEVGETSSSCAVDCPASVGGARGRVHVGNGTVLTDRNTMLRGGTFSKAVDNDAYWRHLRDDLKLNVVRVGVQTLTVGKTPAEQAPWVDKIVESAARNHMYVMLLAAPHTPGGYSLTGLNDFWTFFAPRYKDRTHVFYELTNEPVAWGQAERYTDKVLADLKSVYDIMRAGAPNTHIVLFGFSSLHTPPGCAGYIERIVKGSPGVDWTKASVGYHFYNPTVVFGASGLRCLSAKYPLIMTETSFWVEPRPPEVKYSLRVQEELGISWFSLDGKSGTTNHIEELLGDLHAHGYDWAAEK